MWTGLPDVEEPSNEAIKLKTAGLRPSRTKTPTQCLPKPPHSVHTCCTLAITLYKPACMPDLTMPSLAFNCNTDPKSGAS